MEPEQLKLAYARVFGVETERNDDQKAVWADMQKRGYIYRTTIVPNSAGNVSNIKMESAEGMRIFMLDTMNLVASANRKVTVKQKVKPTENERTNSI